MPPRHHPTPTAPSSRETSGEMLLVVAIVRQAWLDAASPASQIRAEATQWWADVEAVRPWADRLEVDDRQLYELLKGFVMKKG